ncbi:MAG TPA: HAD family hydrolase [Nitrospirota bacterium]|nr:HAD family hydrolase [Nitrospirota bacterium]
MAPEFSGASLRERSNGLFSVENRGMFDYDDYMPIPIRCSGERTGGTTSEPMLIIFDVDGTLCDTHDVDTRCYRGAFESVTGRSLASVDWSRYPEATSSAIVHGLLTDMGFGNPDEEEQRILAEILTRLRDAARASSAWFQPVLGAVELFDELRGRDDHAVAIATGDWGESARFKLEMCGFRLDDVPFASSSDTRRRADIISLAAGRAGFRTEDAVYVGDGPWDARATRELGMRFIGVGHRHEVLRKEGARAVFRSFTDQAEFFKALELMA